MTKIKQNPNGLAAKLNGLIDAVLEQEQPVSRRQRDESVEQKKYVTQISVFYPDTLVFAVPNGGHRHAKEALNLKGEGVLAGVPDIYVEEARGGWFGLRLEFKRPDLKPKTERAVMGGRSKDQARIHAHLARKGYLVHTVYSCTEAMQKTEAYMRQPPTIGIIGLTG